MLHQVDAHRGDQPRPGHHLLPDRRAARRAGRASAPGCRYGLGSENRDLPAFVVLISQGTGNPADQPLYDRLWGSGFLPSQYQGVKFRSVGDPVLYLSNPAGLDPPTRRRMLDDLARLNRRKLEESGDPEIATRIAQYELAYRMQTSVPELTDVSDEPEHIFDLYGPDVAQGPGTFAANCLLARRLAERGVRFIQLFHRGWDQHTNLPAQIAGQCRDTDQPSAGPARRPEAARPARRHARRLGRRVRPDRLLPGHADGRRLRPRPPPALLHGLAGRRRHQGRLSPTARPTTTRYNVAEDPVHVHDLHATMLHCLGIDHTRLTYRFQGRHHRLTDVHGKVVRPILA